MHPVAPLMQALAWAMDRGALADALLTGPQFCATYMAPLTPRHGALGYCAWGHAAGWLLPIKNEEARALPLPSCCYAQTRPPATRRAGWLRMRAAWPAMPSTTQRSSQ